MRRLRWVVFELLGRVVEVGLAPCMPGAWGASARSAPTFLVPVAAWVEPIVVAAGVALGVVWAWLRVAQLSRVAKRKVVFIIAKGEMLLQSYEVSQPRFLVDYAIQEMTSLLSTTNFILTGISAVFVSNDAFSFR